MSKNVSHHNMVNGHCIIMFLFRLKLFLVLPEVGRILVLNRQKVVRTSLLELSHNPPIQRGLGLILVLGQDVVVLFRLYYDFF